MQKVLRLPTVIELSGLSRSSIYRAIAQKQFPAPLKIGARASGWLADDIERWIKSRVIKGAQ